MIGPIGDRHAAFGTKENEEYEAALEVFEKVITPACAAVGLTPIRADQIAAPGEITDQVFKHLRDDEVVIADVSGANPNVMYELGLRHSIDRLTIQIGEFGQLPFDVHNIRTIQFSRSRMGLIDARNELQRALEIGLLEGNTPVGATRIWLEGSAAAGIELTAAVNETAEPEEVPEPEVDEAGLLEILASVEAELPALTEIAGEITSGITHLGEITAAAGADMQENAPDSARARLALMAKFASDIDQPSRELEASATRYSEIMQSLNDNVLGLAMSASEFEELRSSDDFQGFVRQIISFAGAAREAMEGASAFGQAAGGLAKVSRLLRDPGRRIRDAVARVTKATAAVDEWERALTPFLREAQQ